MSRRITGWWPRRATASLRFSRVLTFLYTVPSVQENRETKELCRTISRDIQSLSEHASFISGNITFLLDASLGLINVEQNAIIKIFSIAAVVFLPPTLVASLYGMNFEFMPELKWAFGYPMASLLYGDFRNRPVLLLSLERLALRA